MEGLNTIPADELKHKVTVRHITADGTQDGFGQYVPTTEDHIENCHFEFHIFNDESERVKNKEYIVDYDLLLILLPTASVRQGDKIMLLADSDGNAIFEDEEGNPMTITRVFKIAANKGVHHIEAYCKFHLPQFNN